MQVADKGRDVRGTVILAAVCLVLQLAVAPNVALGNGHANFAMIFSACVALQAGGSRGVVAGFLAGLVFDLSATSPVGLMAFCLTVSSFVLGIEQRNRMAGDLASSMAHFCASALAVSLVYHLAMLLVGQGGSLIDVIVFRTLPTAFLTIVFFVPFAYYYSRVRATGAGIGGPGTLTRGSGHGGTHFTRRGL